jgi:hypothetical protein
MRIYLRKGYRGNKMIPFVKVLIHPYGGKTGMREQSRYVMELHVKRGLSKEEHVHHKDGNPQNNDIENLEILSRKEHYIKHFPKGSNPKKHINKWLLKRLRKLGWTIYDLEDYLGIGESTIHRRLQEYGI